MPDQIAANKRRSLLLAAGCAVAVLAVAVALNALVGGGLVGLLVVLVLTGGLGALAWWKSEPLVLAMSHARPADPVAHARLHNLIEGLCIAAGLPKPGVYVVEDAAPNAFACGRSPKHASVAVTTGMLDRLSRVELEGVLAHELSHVKNYDILLSTLAVTLVGLVALVSEWGLRFLWWGGPRHADDQRRSGAGPGAVVGGLGYVLLAFTPLSARLMRCTVSRRREAVADVTGVSLTRYPPGLIAALEKLRDGGTVVHSGAAATAHLWIASPVARTEDEGRLAWLGRRFNTHPPLDERIQALREL